MNDDLKKEVDEVEELFNYTTKDDVDLVTKDFDVYPYWMILVGLAFLLGFVLGVYW